MLDSRLAYIVSTYPEAFTEVFADLLDAAIYFQSLANSFIDNSAQPEESAYNLNSRAIQRSCRMYDLLKKEVAARKVCPDDPIV